MATTSLWRVHGYIGKVLLYAENPDKTTVPKTISFQGADTDALEDVIAYAAREEATNQRKLVSGVNCSPKTARAEMLRTKRTFDKEDGVIAYHGYQSFREDEVTPELAHFIGIRLATELWGDKYEVLVTTHVDKRSHIHNHFVINTVSFVDGIKFHRTKKDYLQMREKSDALCREYGLSVIETPITKGKHYAEWLAEHNGEPTWRSVIREDVDYAIKYSMTFYQFATHLRDKGYEVERRGSILRLRPPGKERFVRFRSLGERYTEEAIIERILKQKYPAQLPGQNKQHVKVQVRGDFRLSKVTWKGLRALYFYYLHKLRGAKEHPEYASALLREDIRYMDAISEQGKFLVRHKLDTGDDVRTLKEGLRKETEALLEERRHYTNLKRRRNISAEELSDCEEKLTRITGKLKEKRKEMKLCDDILERSIALQAKRQALKERKEEEHERRSGRTTRQYGSKRDR